MWSCLALVGILTLVGCEGASIPEAAKSDILPMPNGRLNVYMLPVGQGDAHVIQCPSGDLTIFDMGTSDDPPSPFWRGDKIKKFFGKQLKSVSNIFISHNHFDHYSLLEEVFDKTYNLKNIYMSCTADDMAPNVRDWIEYIGGRPLIRTFAGGDACGPIRKTPCDTINICPKDRSVSSKIMAANLGQNCIAGNKNIDSIVLKLTYKDVSILYNGDFEDETRDWDEEGPQKKMVDYYGDELVSTLYPVAHHGASRLANKPIYREAIKPKAIFASSNPYHGFGHPRCAVIDKFIEGRSLCKPAETNPKSPFYCGKRVTNDRNVVQRKYTCGVSSNDVDEAYDNEWAIYTSTPDEEKINLVSFTTNGKEWQVKVQDVTLGGKDVL